MILAVIWFAVTTSHIWLVKSMANFFYLTFACQIFGVANF
jgi:hypothetical protein